MIKTKFIIALTSLILVFVAGTIFMLIHILRSESAMDMIKIAQESLLTRQFLNETVLRLKGIRELTLPALRDARSHLEGIMLRCIECHRDDKAEGFDTIRRFNLLIESLNDSATSGKITDTTRSIIDRLDEISTDALIKGRQLMDERINNGIRSIRLVTFFFVTAFVTGLLVLILFFMSMNRILNKNINSLIMASEEIIRGRDVEEIYFSKDFIPVKDAFLRLQKDLRKKEEEIRDFATRAAQAEKLAALGELVAGVSHELNNPMQVIVGFSEILISDPSVSSDIKDRVKKIHESAMRAANIIKNLREFARKRPPRREPVDLRDIMDRVVELLGYELNVHGIRIERDYGEIPVIQVDPDQMQQVFLNIVKNAFDAILEKGKPEGVITLMTSSDDKKVTVSISDSGVGISPENITRIFEPFFTTKPLGKGTGLGLSISYGIIKSHGGDILVRSRPGEGTTFTIELPLRVTEPSGI